MPLNPKDFPDLAPWIYGRNSQDKNKGLSVPQQVRWGTEECARFGWPDPRVTTDTDIGATRHTVKQRPGYKDLVAGLAEPAPEGTQWVLITRSSSRANRQLLDFALLREMCAKLGVYWYSGGQLYDMNNPQDRRILAQEAVDNEYQPEQNRFDSMQQLKQNFLDGKPHGKEAFGYRIVYQRGKAMERVPDEATAPIVREMARRALELESATGIARWLTGEAVPVPSAGMGLPCRVCSVTDGRKVLEAVDRRHCPCDKGWLTRWDHVAVRNVLVSATIAGLRAHTDKATGKTETVVGQWDSIISVEDHDRLVAMFTAPARLTSNRGCAPRWLLSGIPRCGKCDGGKIRSRSGGTAGKARTYECERFCVARNAELVDDLVEETVLRRLEDPELLAALERSDEEAAAAGAEAKALRASYDKWVAEAIEAELSPMEIKQYKDRKLPAIKAAEARAQAAMPMPHVVAAAGPDARAKWDDEQQTPLQAKRDIIRSLLSITIYPAGKRRGFGGSPGVETIEIARLVA
ncbi:recombinase family protein [Nocardia sp. NPDC050175]|uniref:recombinase family protein n=1 Tax=Nocardia sp. NPDC050175 TaxID=3364317 RepID=UPI00378B76ED